MQRLCRIDNRRTYSPQIKLPSVMDGPGQWSALRLDLRLTVEIPGSTCRDLIPPSTEPDRRVVWTVCGTSVMAWYRLYFLDFNGHIERAVDLECDDDAEAVRGIEPHADGGPMELCQGARRVVTFTGKPRPAPPSAGQVIPLWRKQ